MSQETNELPINPESRFFHEHLESDAYKDMIKNKTHVNCYLVNGIRLQGTITAEGEFVIILGNTFKQMVYKHAISTVLPSGNDAVNADGSNRLHLQSGGRQRAQARNRNDHGRNDS